MTRGANLNLPIRSTLGEILVGYVREMLVILYLMFGRTKIVLAAILVSLDINNRTLIMYLGLELNVYVAS